MSQLSHRVVLWIAAVALAWGVFARVYRLSERPFWRDEACVADAVTRLSWTELPGQSALPAPPLFVLAAKATGAVAAPAEVGLRLLPLFSGVLLLPLVYAIARRLRAPRTVALAGMILCSTGLMLVIWSRELRQYEVEAMLSAGLALSVFHIRRRERASWAVAITAVSVLLIGPWLGYGFVFPAATLALMLAVLSPVAGRRRLSLLIGISGLAVLAVSTLAVLHVAAADQAANAALSSYLGNWFIHPLVLHDWLRAGASGAMSTFMMFFPLQWGRQVAVSGVVAAVIWAIALLGLATWPRQGRRDMVCWTVGPWVLMLLAAVAHRYPFAVPRMMVCFAPAMSLAVAAGLVQVCRACSLVIAKRTGPGMVLSLVLAFVPVVYVVNVPLRQAYWAFHDFPSALRLLRQHRRAGETVVVTTNAVAAVRYYARGDDERYCYYPVTAGTLPVPGHDYEAMARDLIARAGRRWWLLTTSERDGSRAPLLRMLRRGGYPCRLVAPDEDPASFGAARLLVVSRDAEDLPRVGLEHPPPDGE